MSDGTENDEHVLLGREATAKVRPGYQSRFFAGAMLAGAALLLSLAAVAVRGLRLRSQQTAPELKAAADAFMVFDECAAEGDECSESKRCCDGGAMGLQCYAKDDYYARCMVPDTCEPGVHDNETHGKYDRWGYFHPDKWSCKEIGKRSEAECSTHHHNDTCVSSKLCVWLGEKCVKSCTYRPWDPCPLESNEETTTTEGERDDDRNDKREPDENVSCATVQGAPCMESKCCADGGRHGLQCYTKDEYYAKCMEDCDDDDWECEKLGDRSRAACWAFNNSDTCPPERCTWIGRCAEPCNILSDQASCELKADHCIWAGDESQCIPSCFGYTERSLCMRHPDRCDWTSGMCTSACWEFLPEALCDPSRCLFKDGRCQKDPCSSPVEDCAETQCCSASRGARGMSCFTKNLTSAWCRASCDPNDHEHGDDPWRCEQLGQTTQGQWSDMVQNTHSTSQVRVQPAAKGKATTGTTLYCIMAILPNSTEEELRDVAQREGASVFGCDAHDVFHSWRAPKEQSRHVGPVESTAKQIINFVLSPLVVIPHADSIVGGSGRPGARHLANTNVFATIFEQVRVKGTFLHYDWTVKVDADCVFVPGRLRSRLDALRAPIDTALYIKNNGKDDMGNDGYFGAVEIFSTAAMSLYFANAQGCHGYFASDQGEDGFFKGCMDAIGVGYMDDDQILYEDMRPEVCEHGNHVAFHPLQLPKQWKRCWHHIMRRKHDELS